MTTWQDASFLLLQAKQIQTNKLAAQPAKQITSQNAGNSNELTALLGSKCKCRHPPQSTEHEYRKDSSPSWTIWEQLRRAVQGEYTIVGWKGSPDKVCSNPTQWCTGDNKFPRWPSQYGSCTGTRKDQQLAHLVPHRVCGSGGSGEAITRGEKRYFSFLSEHKMHLQLNLVARSRMASPTADLERRGRSRRT